MEIKQGKPRNKQSITVINSPRLTSRARLTQMEMWVKELQAMEFSTRQISLFVFGSESQSGTISHISNGKHMEKPDAKPEVRPTEQDYTDLKKVYFICSTIHKKYNSLRDAALKFHGDMAQAQSSADAMVNEALRVVEGKKKAKSQ